MYNIFGYILIYVEKQFSSLVWGSPQQKGKHKKKTVGKLLLPFSCGIPVGLTPFIPANVVVTPHKMNSKLNKYPILNSARWLIQAVF